MKISLFVYFHYELLHYRDQYFFKRIFIDILYVLSTDKTLSGMNTI